MTTKMKRQGKIEIEPLRRRIGKQDGILLLGSCFADEMGDRLVEAGYKVLANPFGTLYNPISIANAMQIIGAETFTPLGKEDTELFTYGIGCRRYGSYMFNTKASRENREEFLKEANATIESARSFFREAKAIIITLGTAWVYEHKEKGIIVANCHKVPSATFRRYRLSLEETINTLRKITAFPGKEYILTVSPIRHLADGEHGNQLSKATLLLAIDALLTTNATIGTDEVLGIGAPVGISAAVGIDAPIGTDAVLGIEAPVAREGIYYFPTYEIVMDELRDFRHYAEDTVHPSTETADYIFRRFSKTCLE